ncbi:low-specificity L-threonine aldolase [Tengunoibacter tsumagoiensis]|uniref:Threonine aldolase n=1 Tax=Tengunoibacter tsumagoiensis TaxID=2014871 RepID=A0A402A1Y0_9CHLR|nr:low-specificity L-threonine aldolase [Tengunoibacter tsumagoiensis]GCE13124.1 threonine aldolase [Tengunoibacter tsumagoiensis]
MTIDLRSDTLTLPTDEMRMAMARADVGDDVYGEDPTINKLQELAAELTGKEAALFVPTGTMGNIIAMLTHAGRGQAIIVGDQSHIYHYEAGGASTLGGSPMFVVPTHKDGMLDLTRVRASLTDESDDHVARTALVCIENTHNSCGGTVLNQDQMQMITDLAHSRHVPVHMDGARAFNAAIALGIPLATLIQNVDSMMFCLSKGLSAPVGSLLVGNQEFIRKARRIRKLLGGGMRQAGVLAAAGIVALTTRVERLVEDHANARLLAEGLAELPQLEIALERVQTNIVIFKVKSTHLSSDEIVAPFLAKAREHGVLLSEMGEGRIRAVTHHGIDTAQISTALNGIKKTLLELHP